MQDIKLSRNVSKKYTKIIFRIQMNDYIYIVA